MNENRENRLIKILEQYNDSTNTITDAIYELIDCKRDKVSLCEIMEKHKSLLKRLESILKKF